ncbi:hypothetical protein [Aeromonas salmonicida]|uniref:hypothetical protein n=1 Tax=Aeromonas salmonicida TaxID=645 RepID=UPI0012D92B17|nr:hypothetical protein [Aeromonas salmonicida]MDM5113242.1 hypothetical protein [Aeromonas salmonicida]MUG29550.1 hypothetical protein [Aeromonas salmonicida]
MSDIILSKLMAHGSQLLLLLERNELSAAEAQMDHYLDAFDGVFRQFPVESHLDMERQQALLQFQMIHDRIACSKHLVEDELRQFSKAGRATSLYKSNAG